MNNLTTINIKSALVSIVFTAVIAVAGYIISLGDVFLVKSHTLINIAILSMLPGVISISKSFLTTDSGKFLGLVQITTPTKRAVN